MSLDKISVTLYDLVGYLLPGYVLLLALSIAEATFGSTTLLALSRMTANPLAFSVAAYFLGQACHALGSQLKDRTMAVKAPDPSARRFEKWWRQRIRSAFRDAGDLNYGIYKRVERELCVCYGLTEDELKGAQNASGSPPDDSSGGNRSGRSNRSFNAYVLADNYIVACGGSVERDVWMAREGFFKASMFAFLMLSVVLLSSIVVGGAHVQEKPTAYVALTWSVSLVLGLLSLTMTHLCRLRFKFFSCLKRTNTLVLFLAMRCKSSTPPVSNQNPTS